MTTSLRFLFAACVAAALSVSASADQAPQLNRIMRAKLAHSQAILGAVVTSDWAALDRESRALAMAVRDPVWTAALTEPEYLRQSDAFSRALQDLIEAAAKRDLEASAEAQVNLTMSCVRCHLHMTRRRIAK
jgi:hypothetical protein